MKDKLRLETAFNLVRNICFPFWDKKRQWKMQLDHSLPSQGKCLSKDKRIRIRGLPESDNDLYLLLIHEICHSSATHHGQKWALRMQHAQQRAVAAGFAALAKLIAEELKLYERGIRPSANDAYNLISDFLVSHPDASYNATISVIAKQLGLYPEEFERRFRRAQRVYEKESAFLRERNLVKGRISA